VEFVKKQAKKTGGAQRVKYQKKHSKKKRVGKGFKVQQDNRNRLGNHPRWALVNRYALER
jgi:hypothetical protein